MPKFSEQIVDDSGYQRPVEGALVFLLDRDGNEADTDSPNPTWTDNFGVFSFIADDGVYRFSARMGGVEIARGDAIIGDPPEYKGDPGPADNTYTTYAALLASPGARRSARLVPQAGESEPAGNFSYINGAWVRQKADGITYAPDAPAIIPRSTDDRLADTIRVHDHGAFGDTNPNPLSNRYSTLEAAKAAYPNVPVIELTDRTDGVAIQAAINRAELLSRPGFQGGYQTSAVVLLRPGRYAISKSIQLPNTVRLVGAGKGVTIIDGQNHTIAAPLIVNKYQGSVDMHVEGISLHAGTHGIKIDSGANGQVNSLTLTDVGFLLQSDKNLEVNRLLQQGKITRCTFALAPWGVYAPAWTTNDVSFNDCSFEDHGWCALYLRSAEAVKIVGGRFEAGGNKGVAAFSGSISGNTLTVTPFEGTIRQGGMLVADGDGPAPLPGTYIVRQITGETGGAGTYEVNIPQTLANRTLLNLGVTIDLDRATANDAGCQVSFRGVYIENTNVWLLRDRHSRDGVSFDYCHFTQALDTEGFQADYLIDGDGVIHFGSNDYSVQSVRLMTDALIVGQNSKLFGNRTVYTSRAPGSSRFRSKRVEVTDSAIIPAVRVTRSDSTGAVFLAGIMTVGVLGFDNASGAVVRFSQRFRLIVYPNAGVLYMEKVSEATTGTPNTATVDIQGGASATATMAVIEIVISGLNQSTPSSVYWSFEEDGTAMVGSEYLKAVCP